MRQARLAWVAIEAATVVGIRYNPVQSRPQLNGAQVTTNLGVEGSNIVQRPPGIDGDKENPASLIKRELNGQSGIVEGWPADKRRKKAANLQPENCRVALFSL